MLIDPINHFKWSGMVGMTFIQIEINLIRNFRNLCMDASYTAFRCVFWGYFVSFRISFIPLHTSTSTKAILIDENKLKNKTNENRQLDMDRTWLYYVCMMTTKRYHLFTQQIQFIRCGFRQN